MKTLEKLYEEIQADAELRKEYVKAAEDKKVIDFLKAHDCDATEAELNAFISSKKKKELGDDELDMVSGGGACTTYSNGWPVVSALNSCYHFTREIGGDCIVIGEEGVCHQCAYSQDEGGILICYCPQRYEDVDDV